ncbi:hypothetical protein BDR03DRAFT_1010122 [Suillus americanus]|nr:hypothetical protein BDR03DRAFT_1010122 [Suillus americanus]
MQLSVLFSAFVSFAILAAASPTPGAISKRSSKRENLDINFQRDLLGEKREELESNLVGYVDYGGSGTSRAIEKREDEEDYAPAA